MNPKLTILLLIGANCQRGVAGVALDQAVDFTEHRLKIFEVSGEASCYSLSCVGVQDVVDFFATLLCSLAVV